MIINLREIPEEGSTFAITRESGELNEALADFIGTLPYECRFFIRPLMNSTFDLSGSIRTQIGDECSRCGEDFKFPIDQSFHELMMPELALPRDAHYSHPNHVSDLHAEDKSVVEYQGEHFNMGEYIHEIVGLAHPLNPAPEPDSEGRCSVCKISLKDHTFGYSEELPEKESPFAALKKLKLN